MENKPLGTDPALADTQSEYAPDESSPTALGRVSRSVGDDDGVDLEPLTGKSIGGFVEKFLSTRQKGLSPG